MNLLVLLMGGAIFAYLACNLGADRRPGHASYGCTPVWLVVLVVLLGWLCWPLVGPLVTPLLTPLLHSLNTGH